MWQLVVECALEASAVTIADGLAAGSAAQPGTTTSLATALTKQLQQSGLLEHLPTLITDAAL